MSGALHWLCQQRNIFCPTAPCCHATNLVLLAVDGDRVHAADIGDANVLVTQQVVGSCRHAACSKNRSWKLRIAAQTHPSEVPEIRCRCWCCCCCCVTELCLQMMLSLDSATARTSSQQTKCLLPPLLVHTLHLTLWPYLATRWPMHSARRCRRCCCYCHCCYCLLDLIQTSNHTWLAVAGVIMICSSLAQCDCAGWARLAHAGPHNCTKHAAHCTSRG